MVKLVDTKDLKSLPIWECQFESGRGHQKEKWGGETCFYSKNLKNKKLPGRLEKKIYPKFNRAIIFDIFLKFLT